MAEAPKRHFSLEEAERLIPRLQEIMSGIMDRYGEVTRLRSALEEAQKRIVLAGGMLLDQESWRSRKAALSGATADVRARIEEILGLGAVPKDLGLGLVDFPSRLDDREINLCWRLGEPRIRFWHGLDEGFASRKPLPGLTEDS